MAGATRIRLSVAGGKKKLTRWPFFVTATTIVLIVFCSVGLQEDIASLSAVKSQKQSNKSLNNGTLSTQASIAANNAAAASSYAARIQNFFERLDDIYAVTTEDRNTTAWLEEYLQWHNDMLLKFPGFSIFTHPDAPKTAIHYVTSHNAGGLHDRLANIPETLQLCHRERRVLFLKWYQAPTDLEAFLQPHLFNWTLPFHPIYTANYDNFQNHVINMTDAEREGDRQATLSTRRIRPVARERFYKVEHGYLSPFPIFWEASFQPSLPVQHLVDETMEQLGLIPKQYDAVHMRVEHPAFFDHNNQTFDRSDQRVDVFDSFPERCLDAAAVSLQCARWVSAHHNHTATPPQSNMTIYFYSDSSHLVKVMADPAAFEASRSSFDTKEQREAFTLLRSVKEQNQPPLHIVGRVNSTNIHISLEDKYSVSVASHFESFAGTFVDLYVASQAKCITVGLGRFSLLAAKISGTECLTRTMDPNKRMMNYWGMKGEYQDIVKCPYIDQPLLNDGAGT
jgi:hypothetical protein